MIRSPVDEQEYPAQQGSAGHLHRLLVDELHSQLVKRGRVDERMRSKTDKVLTRPIATETMRQFFDKGLKMPARAVEQLQGKEPGQ